MDGQKQQPSIREKEIFLEALDIQSPEERSAYLDRECGNDPILRQSLENLLSQEKLPDPLPASSLLFNSVGERAGDVIGDFELLEEIGRGGWGVVYKAEQMRPVRRLVALKIIKLGMDTRQVVLRFESERKTLAELGHTSIAKIYDAGVTKDGRSFFVMEYVEGQHITSYCDSRQLSVHQRVQLFVKVCRAIHHAHLKGTIHRDIKPSNILVSEEDGVPIPKVIDFGIAKATVGEETTQQYATAEGQFIGTPEYMSPEQCTLKVPEIDRRTDIYSLGVLLHELLAGCLPFPSQGFSTDEFFQQIRTTPPKPLSARFADLPEKSQLLIAQARQMEPAKLSRALRGEINNIVDVSLSKDRESRFDTAEGFANALEQYRDQPFSATTEIGGKWKKNMVLGIITASVLLAVSLIFLAHAGFFGHRQAAQTITKESVSTSPQNENPSTSTKATAVQSTDLGSYQDKSKENADLIKQSLLPLFDRCLTVKLAGQLSVESDSDGVSKIKVPIEVGISNEIYKNGIQELNSILEKFARKHTTSSVQGEKGDPGYGFLMDTTIPDYQGGTKREYNLAPILSFNIESGYWDQLREVIKKTCTESNQDLGVITLMKCNDYGRITFDNYFFDRSLFQYLKDMPYKALDITVTLLDGDGKVLESFTDTYVILGCRENGHDSVGLEYEFENLPGYYPIVTVYPGYFFRTIDGFGGQDYINLGWRGFFHCGLNSSVLTQVKSTKVEASLRRN